MATGIVSVGSYIPYYRIERRSIARAWGRGALKGERAVVNTDEDTLTMGVEAALRSLTKTRREDVTALYFATNTPPYAEKSTASSISNVCGLKENIFTTDLFGTTKVGLAALKLALVSAKASEEKILVAAADTRSSYPKSDQEQLFGDAAAAAVVGSEQVIAEFIDSFSVTNEIIDVWRNLKEEYVNFGEGRFITDMGYTASMQQAVKGLMEKTATKTEDFSKVILSSPGLKDNEVVAKKLGFTAAQMQRNLMLEVGNCGAAQPLLMLSDALENAKAGDLILVAAYGNGADALLFKVTEQITNLPQGKTVENNLTTKRMLESYTKFLSFRGQLEAAPGEPFRTFPSNAAYWREQGAIQKLEGSRCKKCSTGIFPVNRICPTCQSKDNYEIVRLAERKAKVYTYSLDALAGSSEDPLVVQTVADDTEGFRYYLIMTDFEKEQIKIGMEVEFTFRKMYVGGNYINYYWKCRPVQRGTHDEH